MNTAVFQPVFCYDRACMNKSPGIPQEENLVEREAAENAAPPPSAPGESLRILLVEDVPTDAELIQRELRKAHIQFSTRCVDTREGYIDSLKDFFPHIVLSDYSMPSFNAMDALHLLNGSPHDIPFILVTGSQSEEVAVQCMKEGADDYVLKSTLKRLPSALLNALKKREAERDRERAVSALQRSEAHFRSLIENALDMIAILNADGTFRYASPSVRVLGYKPDELVGKSIFPFVSADDAREVSDLFNAALQNPGLTGTVEFLFRHKEGTTRILEAICKCIYDESKMPGIVLNARDVSERKQAEAAIEKLAAFPRLNPNPVFELGTDGGLTYFNQAAKEMAESLGKLHPAEILPPDTADVVRECITTGKNNLHRETPVGNRILTWSFFPIIPSHAVHCYAVDITERLNLEAQLRQSQKMDSIGQLAAGVAHDFNNILTIIQGYSGLLLANEKLEEEMSEPLQQIAVASQRAANLTRQLLTFSRKQIMQAQELDLNEVISNITKLLRRILGEDITLHFNYSPTLPLVQADSGMMEQVLMNLAVNARDAMPRGGQLSISTSVVDITDAHVRTNSEASIGKFVCLRVTDTGSGIPPEIMSRIFEPFFTTKEVGKGTGLGLATVYGIVKQHRGWIEVLSCPGQGTTFRAYLPSLAKTGHTKFEKADAKKPRGGNEKILVVEDEPELRSLVIEILEHYGYSVLEASSGPQALEVWEKCAGQVDLLLTDMVMPGDMTGHELAEALKQKKPPLKIVYTSGYSVDMMGRDFVLTRGLNFLQKPYHPLALVKIVRDCLDS